MFVADRSCVEEVKLVLKFGDKEAIFNALRAMKHPNYISFGLCCVEDSIQISAQRMTRRYGEDQQISRSRATGLGGSLLFDRAPGRYQPECGSGSTQEKIATWDFLCSEQTSGGPAYLPIAIKAARFSPCGGSPSRVQPYQTQRLFYNGYLAVLENTIDMHNNSLSRKDC
ncbi:hypothetical protein KSP40_PGU014334 [Platanthera guangdongensis]|uniref:Uncharacterized protein n=1 Tax=Platanthera guangdongensis TaxID=2320717 RepID=A0ABR2LXF3_9ASPA